jgi:hypothetical protein
MNGAAMRKNLLVAVLCCVGCARGNPDRDKFQPGDMALVVLSEESAKLGISTAILWKQGVGKLDHSLGLAPGVRVTVGEDPGYWDRTKEAIGADLITAIERKASKDIEYLKSEKPGKYYPPDLKSTYREVRVVVESGEHRGAAGTMFRANLRPYKKE